MAIIEARNHWIPNIMKELSDEDLPVLFADINAFHKTGVLPEKHSLHSLDKIFRNQCNLDHSAVRMVEDAVLFEMARRYNNYLETERDSRIEGWKRCGDTKVSICRNSDEDRIWEYIVVADRSDNLRLGHFKTEEDARKFVSENSYEYANDGSVEEW